MDSDSAGDCSHRESITGICIRLAVGILLWKTAFQITIALSSTEVEFTAVATMGKYILYLCTILFQIGLPQQTAMVKIPMAMKKSPQKEKGPL